MVSAIPSFWPWVQAIRGYVREHEDSALRSQMGSEAADIAEIVSDVKARFPDFSLGLRHRPGGQPAALPGSMDRGGQASCCHPAG